VSVEKADNPEPTSPIAAVPSNGAVNGTRPTISGSDPELGNTAVLSSSGRGATEASSSLVPAAPEDAALLGGAATIGMQPRMLLSGAWRALAANKLRATLSALGVMIGVFSVVTLTSLAQMGTGAITKSVSSLGVNLLVLVPHPPIAGGPARNLDLQDSRAILQRLRGLIVQTAPDVYGVADIKLRQKASTSTIVGVTPPFMSVCNVDLRAGRFITEQDVKLATTVAVVGPEVVKHLLGDEDLNPIGKQMEINRNKFRIVGVTKEKGASLTGDNDDKIYVPLSTAMGRLYNRTDLNAIWLQARSPESMKASENSLNSLMRQRHRIAKPYSNNDDFAVQNFTQILDVLGNVGGIVGMLVGGIGFISLLVGGIGIMNIMLVSVTERTREIGLRMSVGATRSDILWQFLLEAIFISLIGGLTGLAISLPVLGLVAWHFKLTFQLTGMILIAVFFSVGVGALFGGYPAAKASRQNPIDCLRFE
jgi:putative ABC transport system permease protein